MEWSGRASSQHDPASCHRSHNLEGRCRSGRYTLAVFTSSRASEASPMCVCVCVCMVVPPLTSLILSTRSAIDCREPRGAFAGRNLVNRAQINETSQRSHLKRLAIANDLQIQWPAVTKSLSRTVSDILPL